MSRSALARLEWLMVALQASILAVMLGVPNLGRAVDVFTTGYLSGQNAVALITTLLWVITIGLIIVVGGRAIRGSLRRASHSWTPVALALLVGVSCFIAGGFRHQSATFHPCCGSLERAQMALDGHP